MKYIDFKHVIESYKLAKKDLYELDEIGFNLIDGKYSLDEHIDQIFLIFIENEYGEEGRELVFSYANGIDVSRFTIPKSTTEKKLWKYLEEIKEEINRF